MSILKSIEILRVKRKGKGKRKKAWDKKNQIKGQIEKQFRKAIREANWEAITATIQNSGNQNKKEPLF